MRSKGRLTEWKDAKGYGFIVPMTGGQKIFFHISALESHDERPRVGDVLTYEVEKTEKGYRAKAVEFSLANRRRKYLDGAGIGAIALAILILAAIGYVASLRFAYPNSTIASSIYRATHARSNWEFAEGKACEIKSGCSMMSSCADALFHLERCGVTSTDGDGDGIPCEQQWCDD